MDPGRGYSPRVEWNGYTIEKRADLIGADLRHADLTGAMLFRANLTGARLGLVDMFEGKGLRVAPLADDDRFHARRCSRLSRLVTPAMASAAMFSPFCGLGQDDSPFFLAFAVAPAI